jgi:glucan phosphoethanolaminetransferase (alkaline phosphatase superfamily)
VLSTCTVLLGLILICTMGSRTRRTLPTIVNSPRDMAAVVINISARAFPAHASTQADVTTAPISFASMAIPAASFRTPNSITKTQQEQERATAWADPARIFVCVSSSMTKIGFHA